MPLSDRLTPLTRICSRLVLGLTSAAAVALPSLPANAQATAPTSAPAYERKFGYVTVRDGVRIAYVAYLPAGKGKFATILDDDPYLGASTGNERFPQGGMPPSVRWLEHGYAFVYVSVRGTGCSQGVFDQFGPHEGQDGADVIDWIGRQPWSNQRVGMIGGSYPGHTQIMVAAEHPKWLRAISPSAITMSTYDDISVPGGIFNVAFSSRWSYLIRPASEQMSLEARTAWGDKECQANVAAHPAPNPIDLFRSHPLFDDWWKTRSLAHYVDRVEVPTFISQSWQDHETSINGATEMYAQLKAPKWLSLSNGGHDWTQLQPALQERLVRWMDHWVKGVDNGADKDPKVTVYWEIPDGRPVVAKWSTHYADWPAPGAETKTFYLAARGALSETPVTAAPAQTYTFGPGVELIGDSGQFALEPDPSGALSWTTEAMTQDLMILGATQVHLFVSSENVDTDFVVTLHDIYPNGDVQYLQRGLLRASMRGVDEARSRPSHLYHPYDRPEPLTPGQIYPVRLSLPALGAVLRKGHRLQVTITSPSAIPQPDWGLQPVNMPGRNTVYSSSAYPSRIMVPIMPGAAAEAPEPACGSMPFMPCRRAARGFE
jgi:putative CocE/NonD family hydrolase